MIEMTNVTAGYGGLPVIRNISMSVEQGEIAAVIGANGAGKTTLIRTLCGIIKAKSGSVTLCGKDMAVSRPDQAVSFGCALVPEGRSLFPAMTVRENLLLGAYILQRTKKNAAAVLEQNFTHVYSLFPRLKERSNQQAQSLSGGEQQMLAIGRALMSNPQCIIFDEPSMGLAPLVVKDILEIIASLRQQGKTILVIEQNAKAVLKIADRGYVMENGVITVSGSSISLLHNPEVQRAYLGREEKKEAV